MEINEITSKVKEYGRRGSGFVKKSLMKIKAKFSGSDSESNYVDPVVAASQSVSVRMPVQKMKMLGPEPQMIAHARSYNTRGKPAHIKARSSISSQRLLGKSPAFNRNSIKRSVARYKGRSSRSMRR